MSASIRLFPKFNPYELPVQWGKAYSSAAKAIAKARSLRAITVEVINKNKFKNTGYVYSKHQAFK